MTISSTFWYAILILLERWRLAGVRTPVRESAGIVQVKPWWRLSAPGAAIALLTICLVITSVRECCLSYMKEYRLDLAAENALLSGVREPNKVTFVCKDQSDVAAKLAVLEKWHLCGFPRSAEGPR